MYCFLISDAEKKKKTLISIDRAKKPLRLNDVPSSILYLFFFRA